jgi:hypothetical protein
VKDWSLGVVGIAFGGGMLLLMIGWGEVDGRGQNIESLPS